MISGMEQPEKVITNGICDIKPKKHRRGKKRSKSLVNATEKGSQKSDIERVVAQSDDGKEESANQKSRKASRARMRSRFRYSPQAPRNYTQFIIDDQISNNLDNTCSLDTQSYLELEFEHDYKQVRSAELDRLTRAELLLKVQQLEEKINHLEHLYKSSTGVEFEGHFLGIQNATVLSCDNNCDSDSNHNIISESHRRSVLIA